MKKIKTKKKASLFRREEKEEFDDQIEQDGKYSGETIGKSIERRAKLGRVRNQKTKFALIFLIKTVETFAASVVPSMITVLIIFLNPNQRSWNVMKIVSFFITASVNWLLWVKYAAMKSGPKEFYLMNGLTYLMYFAASIIGYYTLGYLVYSMVFANLRVFEMLGLNTFRSIWLSNGIMVLILVCCERFSHFRFNKFIEWIQKNGADKIEMEDESEKLVPMKKDQVIEALSDEELAEHIVLDVQESLEAEAQARELMPEELWDEEQISKGRGEKLERVEVVDIDNDLTEGDYNAGAAAEKEYEENQQYSGDSLWSSHIYEGRTADGQPITEYNEEAEMREIIKQREAESRQSNGDGSLWSENLYQGRSAGNGILTEEEAEKNGNAEKLDYGANTLWETSFYQGRDKKAVPKKVLDFSDEVMQRTEMEVDSYDPQNLWDHVRQGRGNQPDEAEEPAPEQEDPGQAYDSDSLWGEIHQGRK